MSAHQTAAHSSDRQCPNNGDEHRDVGEVRTKAEDGMAARGQANQFHRVGQRHQTSDPPQVFGELAQRKDHSAEKEQGTDEKREVKVEVIDVGHETGDQHRQSSEHAGGEES